MGPTDDDDEVELGEFADFEVVAVVRVVLGVEMVGIDTTGAEVDKDGLNVKVGVFVGITMGTDVGVVGGVEAGLAGAAVLSKQEHALDNLEAGTPARFFGTC